jgi:hypothetical protein
MNNYAFHGESIKEIYREDIEDSRKQLTCHKLFEFFDDYTYENSTQMGMTLMKDNKDIPYLILFMEEGPKTTEAMVKLLEWRRSGSSDEIGHKGGGNKRNIYGHYSNKTILISKIVSDNLLMASTNPNKIYELSVSDKPESEFRTIVDSSQCIEIPSEKSLDDLPGWYSNLYDKIKDESGILPDYMIRMSLTEIPVEYTDCIKWNELINQIRSKQYKIPIYFKNELLNESIYKSYNNLDLIGITHCNKECEKEFPIYCSSDGNTFYIENIDGKFVDVTKKEILDSNSTLKKWGTIKSFIADRKFVDKQLSEYNKKLKNSCDGKLIASSFFGIYLYTNDKFTNYLPFVGINTLSSPRNTKIKKDDGTILNGCAYLRLILYPDYETCGDRNIFDKLIKTESIKAQTNFVSSSPYEELIKNVLDILAGKPENKLHPIPPTKKISGAVYLIYLGKKLYKFGMVSNKARLNRRYQEHKNESIDKIKELLGEESTVKTSIPYWSNETNAPKGYEEQIKLILTKYDGGEVNLFENGGDKNDVREYFFCEDDDFIIETLIPAISEIRF